MGYLALAVTCSLLIGMIFKWAAREGIDRLQLLTVNYLVAAVLAAVAIESGSSTPWVSLELAAFGTVVGVLFIVGFLLFARATAEAGMALSISVMRISVAIPFLGSWLIWNEPAGWPQWTGLLLAGVALILITRSEGSPEQRRGGKAGLILLSLFLAGGLVDLAMKSFDVWFANDFDSDVFITFVFGAALVTGVIWLAAMPTRRRWPERRELVWGLVLGVVNYGSVWFLLEAVARIPGTIVFPSNSVAIVLGGALIGTLLWKERLTAVNWMGMGAAGLALILLNSA